MNSKIGYLPHIQTGSLVSNGRMQHLNAPCLAQRQAFYQPPAGRGFPFHFGCISLDRITKIKGLCNPESAMAKGRSRSAAVVARWPVPTTEKRAQTSVDADQSSTEYRFRSSVPRKKERSEDLFGLLSASKTLYFMP